MLSRVFPFMSFIAAIVLVSMIFFTTPDSLGPLGIFVFFLTVYMVMLGIMTGLVKIFTRLVFRRKEMGWKDYADAGVLAFWPVMVLVFISIGTANIFFSLLGATTFVLLSIFLIKKV